ncbi:hypothetical protein UL82_03185 [Corynebacterium kutscheri]|uniref:Uncharacterized protein n=1 Tax=Corynebacterium kutscheri TaxID=35755 RepID=A0A0F6TD49_9CORY|nr:hypothetical protein UL82_03185 [Corynebacterium kutscheri]VEH06584.1 Uncharacterised protein [Corynebacterium kutscheri]VEH09148.1 Uncharacterised protein [Corynebacterium kutscheri]
MVIDGAGGCGVGWGAGGIGIGIGIGTTGGIPCVVVVEVGSEGFDDVGFDEVVVVIGGTGVDEVGFTELVVDGAVVEVVVDSEVVGSIGVVVDVVGVVEVVDGVVVEVVGVTGGTGGTKKGVDIYGSINSYFFRFAGDSECITITVS